jgi:transcriptional regulator GlxA family with amidase domain
MAKDPSGVQRSRGSQIDLPGTERRPLDVTVVMFDGGFSSTAIGPIEAFHAAGRLWHRFHGEPEHPRFTVRTASVDGRMVTSAYSVGLTPQYAIDDIKQTDLILLTAPGADEVEGIVRGLLWFRGCELRMSAGPTLAASAAASRRRRNRLADGRRATPTGRSRSCSDSAIRAILAAGAPVTEDGGLFCSGGVYASIDLSMYLVEKFCGHDIALQCAKSLLVSLPRNRQSGYGVTPLSRPHNDERVKQLEDHLQRNFRQDVSMEMLAGQVGMSPRNLIRRFKAATGHLPGAYLQLLRVSAARELLEEGRAPVQSVSSAIGYEDVAFFRTLFAHTGMTPAEYRSRFGPIRVTGELFAAAEAGALKCFSFRGHLLIAPTHRSSANGAETENGGRHHGRRRPRLQQSPDQRDGLRPAGTGARTRPRNVSLRSRPGYRQLSPGTGSGAEASDVYTRTPRQTRANRPVQVDPGIGAVKADRDS